MKILLLILALLGVGDYTYLDGHDGVYALHVYRVQYGFYIVETTEGNYTKHEGAWFGPNGPSIHWAKRFWLDHVLGATRYGRLPIVY